MKYFLVLKREGCYIKREYGALLECGWHVTNKLLTFRMKMINSLHSISLMNHGQLPMDFSLKHQMMLPIGTRLMMISVPNGIRITIGRNEHDFKYYTIKKLINSNFYLQIWVTSYQSCPQVLTTAKWSAVFKTQFGRNACFQFLV